MPSELRAVSTNAEPISLERSRAPEFARIVVIGGGCYGSWYTQQLSRATARGAIRVREVVVVDRDAECLLATRLATGAYTTLPVRVEVAEWDTFLAGWFGEGEDALRHDAMVPSPLMPHVCLDWLIARARTRWPDRTITVESLPNDTGLPWERASPDRRHYVSFATWMCPVNCIEPARCPHTRGARDWSMPVAIAAYVRRQHDEHTVLLSATASPMRDPMSRGPTLRGPIIFHCTHRAYGVGMIDAVDIVRADVRIALEGAAGAAAILVGTMSHCHGALGVLTIS